MNIKRIGLIALLLTTSFLFTSDKPGTHSLVKASSGMRDRVMLPAFLEKGKTYHFTFAVTTIDGTQWLTGKVEKLDTDAGWVYVNHRVAIRKGKEQHYKFEGYSWINMNQVYQCFELPSNS